MPKKYLLETIWRAAFLSVLGSAAICPALSQSSPPTALDPVSAEFPNQYFPENAPPSDIASLYPQIWPTYALNPGRNAVFAVSNNVPQQLRDGVHWAFAGAGALPLDGPPLVDMKTTAYTVGMHDVGLPRLFTGAGGQFVNVAVAGTDVEEPVIIESRGHSFARRMKGPELFASMAIKSVHRIEARSARGTLTLLVSPDIAIVEVRVARRDEHAVANDQRIAHHQIPAVVRPDQLPGQGVQCVGVAVVGVDVHDAPGYRYAWQDDRGRPATTFFSGRYCSVRPIIKVQDQLAVPQAMRLSPLRDRFSLVDHRNARLGS
jgi:hypothetical protein